MTQTPPLIHHASTEEVIRERWISGMWKKSAEDLKAVDWRGFFKNINRLLGNRAASRVIRDVRRARYIRRNALIERSLEWERVVPQEDRQALGNLLTQLVKENGDPCNDNFRVALKSDRAQRRRYWKQARNGCCGSRDTTRVVNGREYLIGFNYGH